MPVFRAIHRPVRSLGTLVAIPCTTWILNWTHAQSTAGAMVYLMLVVGAATYSGVIFSLFTALICSSALITSFCRHCILCGLKGLKNALP